MIKVSPSLLSTDFSKMGESCKKVCEFGADYIHCDVMDGCFVPQITFGHKMVGDIKRCSSLPLDVHLMIACPWKHIEDFCNAGSNILTIHYEAAGEKTGECIGMIKEKGVLAGLSVKPATDIREIERFLPSLDLVLIMSVEPGKGGQSFLESALPKIEFLKNYKTENGSKFLIEVDGGINAKTGKRCVKAGADVLVAGSYIFKGGNEKEAIDSLKNL